MMQSGKRPVRSVNEWREEIYGKELMHSTFPSLECLALCYCAVPGSTTLPLTHTPLLCKQVAKTTKLVDRSDQQEHVRKAG